MPLKCTGNFSLIILTKNMSCSSISSCYWSSGSSRDYCSYFCFGIYSPDWFYLYLSLICRNLEPALTWELKCLGATPGLIRAKPDCLYGIAIESNRLRTEVLLHTADLLWVYLDETEPQIKANCGILVDTQTHPQIAVLHITVLHIIVHFHISPRVRRAVARLTNRCWQRRKKRN